MASKFVLGWSSSAAGSLSARQFVLTANNNDLLLGVEESSAQCVEDLYQDGQPKLRRLRTKRHRAQKRYRPVRFVYVEHEDEERSISDDLHIELEKETLPFNINQEMFPPLLLKENPPQENQVPNNCMISVLNLSQKKSLSSKQTYKHALFSQQLHDICSQLVPKVAAPHLIRSNYPTPSTANVREVSTEKSFQDQGKISQGKILSPLIQSLKDKRRRITTIKRSSTKDMCRREISKAISTFKSKKLNATRNLSPFWFSFNFNRYCPIRAQNGQDNSAIHFNSLSPITSNC